MIDYGAFLNWLKYRKLKKRRKIIESGLMDLHVLSVTYHGRIMLKRVLDDADNGLPEEIRIIYWNQLINAPVDQMAMWN